MHGGLPGHSFVLIDKTGTQRWYGEYPSPGLAPDQLLRRVKGAPACIGRWLIMEWFPPRWVRTRGATNAATVFG